MYLPQTTTSNNTDKLVAGIVTSFLLTGMFVTLQIIDLPNVKQKTETYEEINWTRFRPKPKEITPKPKAEPVKVDQPKPVEIPKPTAAEPQVKKVDISSLKVPDLGSLSQPTKKLNTKPAAQNTQPAQSKVALSSSSTTLGGLNTLLGESSKKLKISGRGQKGSGRKGPATRLTIGSGSSLEVGEKTTYAAGGPSLGAPEGKTTDAPATRVAMLNMADIGGDFDDLSPIYRELIAWMKRNPAAFPDVVSRFMEKSPADLGSIIAFEIQGRRFEMFLMCKENLFEVRVCLLEGNTSTYLIDRGFKENSRFLRVGSVSRTANGNILSFGTTRKAAANNRAAEFYQIFLSWWESVGA